MATVGKELAKEEVAKFHTYQHLYAGANTIMATGPGASKKLVFGGRAGGTGIYTTNKPDEVEYLDQLSEMSGSMITKLETDAEGRLKVAEDEQIKQDVAAAVADSRANSAAEVNPAIVAARENLAQNIAKG